MSEETTKETGLSGTIEAIYIASVAGAPMRAVTETDALEDRGLTGDRYAVGAGFYDDGCQVTLIEAEVLERSEVTSGIALASGEHRRNLVTRGVRLHALGGKRFVAGEAILEHIGARPPCAYLESITARGIVRALSGPRAGICARVVQSGRIRAGDRVAILSAPRTTPGPT